nr:extensin-like [Penaeus vannamei]
MGGNSDFALIVNSCRGEAERFEQQQNGTNRRKETGSGRMSNGKGTYWYKLWPTERIRTLHNIDTILSLSDHSRLCVARPVSLSAFLPGSGLASEAELAVSVAEHFKEEISNKIDMNRKVIPVTEMAEGKAFHLSKLEKFAATPMFMTLSYRTTTAHFHIMSKSPIELRGYKEIALSDAAGNRPAYIRCIDEFSTDFRAAVRSSIKKKSQYTIQLTQASEIDTGAACYLRKESDLFRTLEGDTLSTEGTLPNMAIVRVWAVTVTTSCIKEIAIVQGMKRVMEAVHSDMKETRAPLVALGLVVAATLFASVLAKGGDLATRPRQGRVDLPAHPLYASLPSENRRVLTLGEGDELPNYVYEDDEDEGAAAGEDVVGSFGLQPARLLLVGPLLRRPVPPVGRDAAGGAGQLQVPAGHTRRPPADQAASGSVSSPSQATDNDLNAYSLFPPQFHELLAIPLHVYKNGSTYNPHGRPHHVPLRPFISKGYANTKIQGGSKVRVPEKQDTPHVAYKPKPVYEDAPKRPTTKYQTTTPAPTTSTTTTTTTTTRPPPTTTTDQRPRRPTYVAPPRPYRPTESTTTETYDETTVPYYSRPSSLPFRPPTDSSPASPKPTRRDPPAKVSFNYKRRPTIPSDLPLSGTPDAPPRTRRHHDRKTYNPPRPTTTRRPTTTPPARPSSARPPPAPTTTRRQPDFSYETFRVTSKPAAAPAPARDALPPSSRPTSDGRPRPTPVQQDRPTAAVQPKPTRVERPQEERVVEFRPSKLDPFLPPSPPPTTYRPPAANKITPQGAPQQLPPVVNTFVQPTTAPESSLQLGPGFSRPPPSSTSAP